MTPVVLVTISLPLSVQAQMLIEASCPVSIAHMAGSCCLWLTASEAQVPSIASQVSLALARVNP